MSTPQWAQLAIYAAMGLLGVYLAFEASGHFALPMRLRVALVVMAGLLAIAVLLRLMGIIPGG